MRKRFAVLVIVLLALGVIYAKDQRPPHASRSQGPQRGIGPAQVMVIYDANDPSRIIGWQTFAGGVNLTPQMKLDVEADIMATFGQESVSMPSFFDGKTLAELDALSATRAEAVSGGRWLTVRQSCGPGCPKFDWRCCILVGCSGPAKNCYVKPGVPTPIV